MKRGIGDGGQRARLAAGRRGVQPLHVSAAASAKAEGAGGNRAESLRCEDRVSTSWTPGSRSSPATVRQRGPGHRFARAARDATRPRPRTCLTRSSHQRPNDPAGAGSPAVGPAVVAGSGDEPGTWRCGDRLVGLKQNGQYSSRSETTRWQRQHLTQLMSPSPGRRSARGRRPGSSAPFGRQAGIARRVPAAATPWQCIVL
jgi:hypothetical protein